MCLFRLQKLGFSLSAALCLAGLAEPELKADIISDWNSLALTAARNADDLSPEVSRSLAMMHTAIYNAVEGIAGQHFLYTQGSYTGPSGTAISGASLEAASASAAFTIMQELYPTMSGSFTSLYSNQLSSLADDQARLDGISFGTVVAQDILNWRAIDGAADASNPTLYTPLGSVGHWTTTGPGYQDAALPGWGNVDTFAIAGTTPFNGSLGMSNSDYLATVEYAQNYNTVKDLGSATSATRTTEQLDAAYFWNGAAGTITNVGLWNEVARGVISTEGLGLLDSARLYASLNVALADSAIVTWDTKYEVDFWSPVTAINNGSADGNASTIQDSNWLPLLDSPNYPSYFAEQAALGAAASGILESFVGSSYAFTLGSDTDGDGNIDITTSFSSFDQALQQAINSGVWGGIYDPKSATDAATAGGQIADFVLNNQFAPVPEPTGALLVFISGLPWLMRRRRV